MFPIPLGDNPDGVTIPVLVVPGASRREVVGPTSGDWVRPSLREGSGVGGSQQRRW